MYNTQHGRREGTGTETLAWGDGHIMGGGDGDGGEGAGYPQVRGGEGWVVSGGRRAVDNTRSLADEGACEGEWL